MKGNTWTKGEKILFVWILVLSIFAMINISSMKANIFHLQDEISSLEDDLSRLDRNVDNRIRGHYLEEH